MFESLLDDMSHPKEAKNYPYRLEPTSDTDTGMSLKSVFKYSKLFVISFLHTNFNSVIILHYYLCINVAFIMKGFSTSVFQQIRPY